jgi:hypothetical protein
MIVKRISDSPKRALLLVLISICVSAVNSLTLDINQQANWAITQTSFTLPTVAGMDLTPTTLESVSNQAKLSIKAKKNDPIWVVTVQRTTSNWYSGVHIYVRRTSSDTSVEGGTNYDDTEITGTAQDFFWSTVVELDALNVACQFKLTGLSVSMGASNSTTITYTVMEK